MNMPMKKSETDKDFVFEISRTFNAPRERVFKAWTDPELLKKWWGPKGFLPSIAKVDLRPGGLFHYCLSSANGYELWGRFLYQEIVPPEKIVYISSFSDAEGGITSHPMAQGWPREIMSIVTFTEENGRTTVTVRWSAHNATDAERKIFEDNANSMNQGWSGTFGKLEEFLANNGSNGGAA